jgi:SAM-dependent methyltransferase
MQYTRRLLMGIATYLPGVPRLVEKKSTGGTVSARYCYLVWLRHLVLAGRSGLSTNPTVVAELGPGDSLGTGIAALLSGASRYYAFDVLEYASPERNLRILDDLVELFRRRARLPDGEFKLRPSPAASDFPDAILTQARLEAALAPARVQSIRRAIEHLGESQNGIVIAYYPRWTEMRIEPRDAPDLILSQAVLEHIDDLELTYDVMHRWLGPEGYMSHAIDFRSHDFARDWNGHWTYSDRTWALIRGRRPYAINRAPLSRHLELIDRAGLELVWLWALRKPSGVTIADLAPRFRSLTDQDLTTASVFIQAARRARPKEGNPAPRSQDVGASPHKTRTTGRR